ncbi:hypothetical protein [Sediminibacterium ginsengisoli]|uniref:DUF748 domain-containing protein n=1 Tax=Sediminibacterium ginsengisoli TaxID=413434 RepID=A0A1T4Q039_9BACT|nr:hypothetical protein [Sediminibacterium ginsengisoli]SJZ97124.1 hypothetical protein SAMN04488132_10766 [Sediminibacterium ginsengisoli]
MMTKKRSIWVIVLVLLLSGGIFWWTTRKKDIVKQAVLNVVKNKTDSLYKLSYDSSELDEVNGNAFLYNVSLRIDSSRLKALQSKGELPAVTMDVHVAKLTILGLASLDLLTNTSLEVKGIELENPVIMISRWKSTKPDQQNDTLELYQRITGRFEHVKAGYISIRNGNVVVRDTAGKATFSALGISTRMDNLLVDSAHSYRNIMSYFVKQADVKVTEAGNDNWKINNVIYKSAAGYLAFDSLTDQGGGAVEIKVARTTFTGLDPYLFVYHQQFKSRRLNITGADIRTGGKLRRNGNKPFRLPAVFSSVIVDSLTIEKGNFNIHNAKGGRINVTEADLLLRNVQIDRTVKDLAGYIVSRPITADVKEISVGPAKGIHRTVIRNIRYDGNTGLSVATLDVNPVITRAALAKRGMQKDLYNIHIKDLFAAGFDLPALVKGTITAKMVRLQLDFKVYNDKTLRMDSIKRIGNYPHQLIGKSKTVWNIPMIELKNSTVTYEEKAAKSGLMGAVHFTNVNATVQHVTNMPELLKKDPVMLVRAEALFERSGKIKCEWQLPVNTTNGSFTIQGSLEGMDLTKLNPVINPLSMASIRSGYNELMQFTINGNNTQSHGDMLFTYKDLKVDLLKKDDRDSLEKKEFMSFLANSIVRNNHRATKPQAYTFERDVYKSFFNLVWKSIFEGVKNTVMTIK